MLPPLEVKSSNFTTNLDGQPGNTSQETTPQLVQIRANRTEELTLGDAASGTEMLAPKLQLIQPTFAIPLALTILLNLDATLGKTLLLCELIR